MIRACRSCCSLRSGAASDVCRSRLAAARHSGSALRIGIFKGRLRCSVWVGLGRGWPPLNPYNPLNLGCRGFDLLFCLVIAVSAKPRETSAKPRMGAVRHRGGRRGRSALGVLGGV